MKQAKVVDCLVCEWTVIARSKKTLLYPDRVQTLSTKKRVDERLKQFQVYSK